MLAAAGLYALDHHVARLAEDHRRAAALAGYLRGMDGVRVLGQHTNMVYVVVPPARLGALDAHLQSAGVRISAGHDPALRLVTHLDIDDAGIARVVEAFASFFAPGA